MTDVLIIVGRCYPAQLILLEFSEFDLILGMDWLAEHNVYIEDYKKKELAIG